MNTEYSELNFDDVPAEVMQDFTDGIDMAADRDAHYVERSGWTPDEQKK